MTKTDGCQYKCVFHKGKVEWHHPISLKPEVGLHLCEAHHSLLKDRKVRYSGEMVIDKTLNEMKSEIIALMLSRVSPTDIVLIDKE